MGRWELYLRIFVVLRTAVQSIRTGIHTRMYRLHGMGEGAMKTVNAVK